MNVYVESNFVLELVLVQEQSASCERLLELCASGVVRLIVPACSLSEPYETLARRHKERTQLRMALEREFNQLGRTVAYTQRAPDFESVVALLVSSADEESDRLEEIRSRLLRGAEVIPLDQEVFVAAADLRGERALSPQDALVFASIACHLRRESAEVSCFLNRDLGFRDPDLVAELERYSCKLLPRFDQGYDYVRSALARKG